MQKNKLLQSSPVFDPNPQPAKVPHSEWDGEPVPNALYTHFKLLISCVVKVDLVADTIDAADYNIKAEENKRFEGIPCHAIISPEAVVVHHLNTPLTFAAMVCLLVDSRCTAFLACILIPHSFRYHVSRIAVTCL